MATTTVTIKIEQDDEMNAQLPDWRRRELVKSAIESVAVNYAYLPDERECSVELDYDISVTYAISDGLAAPSRDADSTAPVTLAELLASWDRRVDELADQLDQSNGPEEAGRLDALATCVAELRAAVDPSYRADVSLRDDPVVFNQLDDAGEVTRS